VNHVVVTLLLAAIVGLDLPWALLAVLLVALRSTSCTERNATPATTAAAIVRLTRQVAAGSKAPPAGQILGMFEHPIFKIPLKLQG
jgi:hypothetical protein